VVSHISRKTSEIWGTQGSFVGTERLIRTCLVLRWDRVLNPHPYCFR
jgi:hypothetical protein